MEAQKQGINPRITCGMRTFEEQDKLYKQGRETEGGIVTNAKGSQSYHNYGVAFDVVEISDNKAIWDNDNWSKIGELGKKYGFEWGGDWKSFVDKPHFQKTFGHNHKELLKMYNDGDIDKGGFLELD